MKLNIAEKIAEINASNVSTTQKAVMMSDLKLKHYNEFLSDPNRDIAAAYPGFPGEDGAQETVEQKVQKLVKSKKKEEVVAEQIGGDMTIYKLKITEADPKPADTKEVAKKEKKEKGPKKERGVKRATALQIYKECNGVREAFVPIIMSDLKITRNNAYTYFYNCANVWTK